MGSRLADHVLKTKFKYKLVNVKSSSQGVNAQGLGLTGSDRQTPVFAKELEAFAPDVFSSSSDAVPVTLEFASPYSSAFAWFSIVGYTSVDTVAPFTVRAADASMPCTSSYVIKMRTIPLVFFPFVTQPDTDFYSRAYMTSPTTIPQATEIQENFRKTWMLGLVAALQKLERDGRIGR